ncbi:MAG: type II toxin-antitoxin system VapC family toxin [Planctomycetota bacterium]
MTYLLDTNVCVQYLRGRNALVLQRLQDTPSSEVCLCAVVQSELFLGALRSANPPSNRAKVDAFVMPYVSFAFDDAAALLHAHIRHQLETAGMPIGPSDLQIAAIALANGLRLVTHNTAEFCRVPGLLLDDWESP